MSRTHNTEHQTCGACGATFPATYWHECPGDQIAERVTQQIAAWVARHCVGWSARLISDAIRTGTWKESR